MCVGRQKLVPRDDVGPRIEHSLSECSSVQARSLEIFQHGPGTPAPHQFGRQGVHAGTKQGDTAPITEGAGGDIAGSEAYGRTMCAARGAKGVGELAGRDMLEFALFIV